MDGKLACRVTDFCPIAVIPVKNKAEMLMIQIREKEKKSLCLQDVEKLHFAFPRPANSVIQYKLTVHGKR